MVTRIVRTASVVFVFALLVSFAVLLWEGASPFITRALEQAGDQILHDGIADDASSRRTPLFGACNDDAALFTACEAPIALPVEAVATTLGSPHMMPTVIFIENSTVDTNAKRHRCSTMPDSLNVSDAHNNPNPTAASCCGNVEFPSSGVAGTARGASCSCDPKECKCT